MGGHCYATANVKPFPRRVRVRPRPTAANPVFPTFQRQYDCYIAGTMFAAFNGIFYQLGGLFKGDDVETDYDRGKYMLKVRATSDTVYDMYGISCIEICRKYAIQPRTTWCNVHRRRAFLNVLSCMHPLHCMQHPVSMVIPFC